MSACRRLGVVTGDHVIRQHSEGVLVALPREVLKRTHPDVAPRHPRQDSTRLMGFTRDSLARRDCGERTCAGDTQCRHRLADDVLAQDRTESRTSIAVARERSRTRTFELNVATYTIPIDQLAQENCPTVAQPGHPAPKLKSRIRHGQWLGTLRHSIPSEHFDALGCDQELGVESELAREALVQTDQARLGHRGWRQAREETLGKSRVAVVEREQ